MDKGQLHELAVVERAEKEVLLAKRLDYYVDKTGELQLDDLERFKVYHPDPSEHIKSGITFAHRDLGSVAEAMASGSDWSVVSGLNPSAPLHMGHKQVFDELLWCQQQGAEIFIPLTNDESFLTGKSESLAESREMAQREIIPGIIAMGFESERTHIFVDSDYPDIYNFAVQVSKETSLSRVYGVFGFGKDEQAENTGTMFYRAGVQLAQILLPQLAEFGGAKPTLVPVGIDQYPYVHLSRDVARKFGMTPPSAVFTKFEDGLDGKGKMSASRKGSAVFLSDDEKTATKKIKSSYTGGSLSGDFQRENGGIPEICPVFQLRSTHFAGNEDLYQKCSGGEILCGECKAGAVEEVANFLTEHQAKVAEVTQEDADAYQLKTPIDSILGR